MSSLTVHHIVTHCLTCTVYHIARCLTSTLRCVLRGFQRLSRCCRTRSASAALTAGRTRRTFLTSTMLMVQSSPCPRTGGQCMTQWQTCLTLCASGFGPRFVGPGPPQTHSPCVEHNPLLFVPLTGLRLHAHQRFIRSVHLFASRVFFPFFSFVIPKENLHDMACVHLPLPPVIGRVFRASCFRTSFQAHQSPTADRPSTGDAG
jgi:hypothetical protein